MFIAAAVVGGSLAVGWPGSPSKDGSAFVGVGSQGQEKSVFGGSILYIRREDKPVLKVESSEFTFVGSKTMDFLSPRGVVVASGREIGYRGGRGSFGGGVLRLGSAAVVTSAQSRFEAENLEYFLEEDKLTAFGDVKTENVFVKNGDRVEVSSDSLIGLLGLNLATYYGGARGKIERKRAYEKGLDFRSETIRLDIGGGRIFLERDVVVDKKGVFSASADRGEIFLENYNKKIKYFALYNDVQLVERVAVVGPKGRRFFERRAFSEMLESVVSENRILLTGSPRVIQRGDVIKGNGIVLRENNETIEVEDANTNFILR